MRKLIVSDYDGAFKPRSGDVSEIITNVGSVKGFRESGNIFMMSTGRVFESILLEQQKYGFELDYVSCANANVIFDSDWNVLFERNISDSFLKPIKKHFKVIDSIEGRNAYSEMSNSNIIEYVIRFKNLESRKRVLSLILLGDEITYYTDSQNKLVVHMFSKLYDKTNAIIEIARLEKINRKDIYTIGDGNNDVEMLKHFNGYSMNESSSLAMQAALGQYPCVSDFVYDIQAQKVKTRIK